MKRECRYNRIVVKVGTKVITSKDRALDKDIMRDIVRQISDIQAAGTKVIVVTSGAIGAGMWLVGMKRRPSALSELQAVASIGQSHLMHIYSEYFKAQKFLVGQMLLTQEDFGDRKRYLNIKHTVNSLLRHNAVPVINENDTVATEEIKCGDNDRLSSLVSDLCQADMLVMLTDVDGLLDRDGRLIRVVEQINKDIVRLGGRAACDLGTGGMATKIESAKTVTQAGIECVIANGKKTDVLLKILKGESVGTVFKAAGAKFIAKKRWIAFSSRVKGLIRVDDGARRALENDNKSLLASGVLGLEGTFDAGDVVGISGPDGSEFARGVVAYSSEEIDRIRGAKTSEFKGILGYKGRDEIVHKDNLVIL